MFQRGYVSREDFFFQSRFLEHSFFSDFTLPGNNDHFSTKSKNTQMLYNVNLIKHLKNDCAKIH